MARVIIVLLLLCSARVSAQTADSFVMRALEDKGVVFTHNNSISLLTTGQHKFDDLFNAIRQARHSVHLEYFNFRNDTIASLLFDILAQKAAEGVEVRALFDGFGNDSNNQPLQAEHIAALRARGIQIYEFDPIVFPYINHIFARDHRKIVVIDGAIAYTGGMNVADYYINGTEQVGEWHDMHCRVEGGAVNQLQLIFVRMWRKVTGEDIWHPKYFNAYFPPTTFQGLSQDTTATSGSKVVGLINREPQKSSDIIRTFYLAAINGAHDSIKLINPYLTLNGDIKRALKRAAERGVKVEIMVSAKSDIPLTPDCVFYNVHNLMKHGAHIWIYKPGFHHTKVIMVDGLLCTIGSANLNARSLSWDYEENMVILDRCTTQELDAIFERDKGSSFYLTEQAWDEFRTPLQKFVGWLSHLLTPFL